jgi:N-acetylglucosaminyldiphosphoundecaprenol N-acetyl-beta-D-mannosaminyltransferase
MSEVKGYKVFFYGNKKETLSKLSIKIKLLFPKINIVGLMPSKFRNLDNRDIEKINSKISLSKATIVFVSLGSPMQEIVSYKLLKINCGNVVIVPVGAAFDFISGAKKQAPILMQNYGLEWLFRLIMEPKRLWKRYLVYGSLFIFYIFCQKARVLFYSRYNKIS